MGISSSSCGDPVHQESYSHEAKIKRANDIHSIGPPSKPTPSFSNGNVVSYTIESDKGPKHKHFALWMDNDVIIEKRPFVNELVIRALGPGEKEGMVLAGPGNMEAHQKGMLAYMNQEQSKRKSQIVTAASKIEKCQCEEFVASLTKK